MNPIPARLPARLRAAFAVVCGALACASLATAQTTAAQTPAGADSAWTQPPRRVGLAVQQTLLSNFLVNRFNAWALGADWAAEVDFETWNRNLRLGWEWDEDAFATNMFGHPYQGASYFNAGRANGLSYWESIPLAAFGSWTWEHFGEIYRPSMNDFFMTTFGGISVGEMTHRVAATIRDEQSRGAGRIAREIAALVVDPTGGLNRLVRGQWTRVGPNPPAHDPGAFAYSYRAGLRHLAGDAPGTGLAPILLLDVAYGDAFRKRYREPFDVFSAHVQVSGGGGVFNALQTSGRVYQAGLPSWSGRFEHAFSVDHRFDYLSNPLYRFGAQTVEAGLLSRFPLLHRFELRTRLAASFLVLGAISAPESVLSGSRDERAYDFGPGVGAAFSAELARDGRTLLATYNRAHYLHSVSGTPADHLVALTGLKGTLPLYGNFGVGLDLSADTRRSRYKDVPDLGREFAETRLFVSWTSSRKPRPR